MPDTESTLKSRLMVELHRRQGYVALRHEDVRTAGIPDLSLTGKGRTTWWEMKFDGGKGFKSAGIQELTMLRLASVGYARYIIWEETGVWDKAEGVRRTLIVHPRDIGAPMTLPDSVHEGFHMVWLADQMTRVHEAPDRR